MTNPARNPLHERFEVDHHLGFIVLGLFGPTANP